MKYRVDQKQLEREALALEVKLLDRPPEIGEMYLAGRNTGVKLLRCRLISNGAVYSDDQFAYPYDIDECRAIKE